MKGVSLIRNLAIDSGYVTAVVSCFGVVLGILSQPAFAQSFKVDKNALEKATWHTAPREFQIIDDRPIIKDFREAPATPQQVEIPLGPANGASRGLGGPKYRLDQQPLPKAGFGSSNIPTHAVSPRGLLPGYKTSVLGQKANQNQVGKPMVAHGRGSGQPKVSVPNGPPVTSTYGGYNTAPSGVSSGDSTRTQALVRGSLLRH